MATIKKIMATLTVATLGVMGLTACSVGSTNKTFYEKFDINNGFIHIAPDEQNIDYDYIECQSPTKYSALSNTYSPFCKHVVDGETILKKDEIYSNEEVLDFMNETYNTKDLGDMSVFMFVPDDRGDEKPSIQCYYHGDYEVYKDITIFCGTTESF